MRSISLLVAVSALLGSNNLFAATACVDFDAIAAGSSVNCCLNTVTSNGVDLTTQKFKILNTNPAQFTTTGVATIDNSNKIAGTTAPNEVRFNNVNLQFDIADYEALLGGQIQSITFKYADLGGYNNIRVNGDWRAISDFTDIANGSLVGGVLYSATASTVTLTRVETPITEFGFGGQELWADDVCATR
jgi:hypothetical protein